MNIPRIQCVEPREDYTLIVTFTNGIKKEYDASYLIEQERFEPLKNYAFFKNVFVDLSGYAVSWNSEIDISEYELWQQGKSYHENAT